MTLLAYWRPVVAILLALALYGCGYRQGGAHGRAEVAQSKAKAERVIAQAASAETAATNRARAAEQAKADAIAGVAEAYEKGKVDAKATADRTAADLRAGTLRLRDEWAQCETGRVSGVAASAAERDAAAAVRERLAAEIVQVGAEADAQVRALQGIVREDRR